MPLMHQCYSPRCTCKLEQYISFVAHYVLTGGGIINAFRRMLLMKLRQEKYTELITLTSLGGLFLSCDLVVRQFKQHDKNSRTSVSVLLLFLFFFLILASTVECILFYLIAPFSFTMSEYKLSKWTDQVSGLLYGKCHTKPELRSGADGVAN